MATTRIGCSPPRSPARPPDLELVDVIHRESRRSGDGVTLHFRKPSAEDRLRDAVQPRPLRLGADEGHLTYPELAEAIDQRGRRPAARPRRAGRPDAHCRRGGAPLQRSGLLRRVAMGRSGNGDGDDEPAPDARLERGGAALLATLLREELWRDEHRSLIRLGDADEPQWWLREPELAESPLADRVEWSTFSILSTAGRLDEQGFLDRIYALFPGLDSPDEELVRACLAAYAASGERGQLRTDDELSAAAGGARAGHRAAGRLRAPPRPEGMGQQAASTTGRTRAPHCSIGCTTTSGVPTCRSSSAPRPRRWARSMPSGTAAGGWRSCSRWSGPP